MNREVVLVFDEMTIRESLVFDDESGNIVGFVNVGDIYEKLKRFESSLKGEEFENEVATHMLTIHVRGIFFKMEYPLANFPTSGK